ncbi:pilus assembly protein [Mesorhizobium sp. M6A.T.Ce.TU.002.03.1.1]|uniref:TadE/TadG family type IV pilus assembly protein n=1 Tax=unclassified Mesorhizobium TaxID=325217 RepID=UPI000FCCB68B|nr:MULTISPECIES: TadE/TadG family type IV pilus assembly protein [unclassified Mesorhizobium]RUU33942.1 pilus assembly protein [Mesorhizobium sp. M6A.T.Ce.TU.002.03.1.1]RUU98454.1 pilus assembly protein [Mesorhizobium sp. M6A.T.Cr.TU.017.01.1.1]RWP71851.1 MAG: pilus assembly protein [Mesorhizobium sp.]RWQ64119.1 MAG: pilus assembly protein [Mesorhizobium sp.]TIT04001.1 MAG: pilus assembly protein [Mesorhizobium sp.]
MIKRFAKSEDGAAMVEMTIVATLLFALVLGFVDFGHAFYQWNAATKAVQLGARLASISDPVATALATAAPTTTPGAPVVAAAYGPFVCAYTAGTGACSNGGTFNAANFSRIFRGDTAVTNDDACPALATDQRPGMCHFFPGLRRDNVVIAYSATGLGYQTRFGGPVPTITVSLQNRTFQFFFLQGLMGFADITMPSMLSTVTGEDLKSTAS